MKKITSVILVAVMLLAMLPMCVVTAAAGETAGQVTYQRDVLDGNAYESVVIYDKGDPIAGTGGWQHYTDAAGSELAASGREAVNAAGVLIDVKWEDAASTVKFKFKFTDGGNGGTSGYFYGKGDNISGFLDDKNWILINATNWEGTIFIPKELLNNWETADVSKLSVALTNGTYDNIRLAYALPTNGPVTLPDVNKTWDVTQRLFPSSQIFDVSTDAKWQAGLFDANANATLVDSPYGMMFTIDATKLDAGLTFDFAIAFKAEWGNGRSTYLAPTPYGACNLGDGRTYTNVPEVKPQENPVSANWVSDWYLSYDGGEWTKVSQARNWLESESRYAGGRYGVVPNAGGKVVSVYIPISDFWTRDGEQYLTTGTRPSGKENIVDFAKFCEIVEAQVGKDWGITEVRFDYNKTDGTNADVKISNFWLVSCGHDWSEGTQIKAPTHTEFGLKNSTCSKCNQEAVALVEKTTAHEPSSTIVYIDANTHGYLCPCGLSTNATAHTWGEPVIVIPATHITNGVARRSCTAEGCTGEKLEELLAIADAHDWVYTEVDADQHRKHCSCGQSENLAHVWDAGVVTTEATEEAEGVKTFTCADCGATKTEAIAKLVGDDGGCGSVIGSGFAMMAILSGVAVVLNKKRRK